MTLIGKLKQMGVKLILVKQGAIVAKTFTLGCIECKECMFCLSKLINNVRVYTGDAIILKPYSTGKDRKWLKKVTTRVPFLYNFGRWLVFKEKIFIDITFHRDDNLLEVVNNQQVLDMVKWLGREVGRFKVIGGKKFIKIKTS